MLDDIKPGQTIRCTVLKDPQTDSAYKTVARLMRFDPEIKRKLKAAQEFRMKNLYVRSRGKRPWAVRQKAARYAVPHEGASWTMTYFPRIRPDFESVRHLVKIENA